MSDIYVGKKSLDLTTAPQYEPVTGVRLVVSDDVEYSAGDATGRVMTVNSPWGTQQIADDLLEQLSGYRYQPLDVSTIYQSNPLWEVGDTITVSGGIYGQAVQISSDFSHQYAASVVAPDNGDIEHEYPYTPKAERELKRKQAQAFARLQVGIDNITGEVQGALRPPAYDEEQTYRAGSYVYHAGNVYKCISATSGEFDPAAWAFADPLDVGLASSLIYQGLGEIRLQAVAGANQSTITISANGIEFDTKVVTFSSIEADSIVANSYIESPKIYGGTFFDRSREYGIIIGDYGLYSGLQLKAFNQSGTIKSNVFGVYDTLLGAISMDAYEFPFLNVDSTTETMTLLAGLILERGKNYGTIAERDAITNPQDGQLFFVI